MIDPKRISRVQVVDSHTAGEPTRVVVSGGPDLGPGDMAAQREVFRTKFDDFRSAVVNEPRGSDAMVGALLREPLDPTCAAGVIYFNNVGMLHMCVHGTIGLVVTLAHLGRIGPGTHRIETPVGVVSAELEGTNLVTVRNVPSYRYRKSVRVDVDGLGTVHGDIAWGGNWFFLVDDHHQDISLANLERLTDVAWRIRQALTTADITGAEGGEIDHIELFGPSPNPNVDSRNFVLCPGKAYDRSPCGTGTSAKIACLIADGKLPQGRWWQQESVIGSRFEATGSIGDDGKVLPVVRGTAYVNAESILLLQDDDPFRMGIRA